MAPHEARGRKRIVRQCLSLLGLNRQDSQSLSSIPLLQRIKVAFFAALALWLVAYSSLHIGHSYGGFILLASMGASSVLLFGLPNSPLASPWSFVGGHIIPAAIGVGCSWVIQDMALLAAVTIALTLLCMYTFECIHPPGGATALVPVFAAYEQPLGFDFLLYPVASGVLILLLLSLFFKRWVLHKPLINTSDDFDPKHQSQNRPPLKRHGLQPEDFLRALNSADTVLDIGEQDLESLCHKAQSFAYERQQDAFTCASIMSRDVITVSSSTAAADAWKLFHKHRISSMPVVDGQRLVGMVSSVDFFKNLTNKPYWSLLRQLSRLVHKRKSRFGRRRTVAELMVGQAHLVKARDTSHIVALIPLLSDAGYHHIPVVDAQDMLVGIITQSDLIAGLYGQLQNGMALT
ncbi:HPP family protein [Simiduia curdlanivorans]|uniref:HPP family protein n=1 Tax=Simiduia curdlanivorans TaxID=1492769 RepID=A0ABV8V6W5_9GAMM|nr:HPP family protein [Simiduia curdlanivorans]MDN3640602.1 HPP family protein [Simiduia curdlanivorans]